MHRRGSGRRIARTSVISCFVLVILASCTSSLAPSPSSTPSSSSTTTPPPSASGINHVIVVWLENKESSAISAASMPYLYGLSSQYGRATQMYGTNHPSLPNYLAFWSGSDQGMQGDDGTHDFAGASIANQMDAAGLSWRTYAQNYPDNGQCNKGSSYSGGVDGWGAAGQYVRRHNPAMSFTYISANAGRCANIQSLSHFNPLVNFAFVIPNMCNNAHDCGGSLPGADSFLQAFLPQVFNSSDWAHTLLIVTFDEGTTSVNGGGNIFMLVARPGLAGVTSATTHNHYGVLRTIENVLGLPCLGNACSAAPLSEFLP